MRHGVCVLSAEEIELWEHYKLKPKCSDHPHVKRVDSMEMMGKGDFRPYQVPIADPVPGLNAIRLKKTFSIRGLSCRIFEYHLRALAQGSAWARVMLQDMRRRS